MHFEIEFQTKFKNQITGFKYELGENPTGLLELYVMIMIEFYMSIKDVCKGKRKRRKVKPIRFYY